MSSTLYTTRAGELRRIAHSPLRSSRVHAREAASAFADEQACDTFSLSLSFARLSVYACRIYIYIPNGVFVEPREVGKAATTGLGKPDARMGV